MVKLPAISAEISEKNDISDVIWQTSAAPVPYPLAIAEMERQVEAISRKDAPEQVWLLEHPPVYTAGTSARPEDLLTPDRFPVYQTGRGGQYTYHGPGQRVIYLMLDLARREKDVRRFVGQIESWIIDVLSRLDVKAHVRPGRTGIWIKRPEKGADAEDKIAAIGIRVRRWISFHGVSLNVSPDLSHYDGIVACGISDQGVTSLLELNKEISMVDTDAVLAATFPKHFGPKSDN